MVSKSPTGLDPGIGATGSIIKMAMADVLPQIKKFPSLILNPS